MGQRIVVRRVLREETGPSGGPAMTDLLGVCTAWGASTCVVRPETGEPVTIALADIVSGKPVPPRPSVRHRVSARDAESHALVLWPTVETESVGQWLLRSETRPLGRLLKRANSALAIGDPGVPLDEAVARLRRFYALRDRDPMAQVEVGGPAERYLDATGWREVPGGAASFLLGSLARALRACGPATGREAQPGVLVDVEEDGPRVAVELRVDGRHAAAGQAGHDGDWLGVHSVHVAAQHRRRGLALTVMRELLDWGAARGAVTVWLHVEVDNQRALGLYEKLGLSAHHELRYLRP